ncbi:hypothetical protein ADIARSV_2805 [Arcticibacter svalbardensis MN12-7]|uniref:Glycosyltransferase 2-like domain-containing protein n=2 Tax=Arcticibacter TaxID=1288026 RepID=R9GQG9_9SPHI|nr:hypothetical protein ADIARSV_2805 [Arcticibacter svalbardensis MN12-7]
MNKLFVELLRKNTDGEIELIVIDNNSTDGSREFFKEHADKLILNDKNYSYSYCQNQGIQVAKYDYLAFFNNDMLLSKSWDAHSLELMRQKPFDIISFASDFWEQDKLKKQKQRQWKRIKYPFIALFGRGYNALKIMAFLMYGDWDDFCKKRFEKFGYTTIEGFSGSSIFMRRSVLDKVGIWDNRIHDADFDIYMRVKARNLEVGDIEPLQIAIGIFFHHYSRLTLRSKHEPFADASKLITLKEKWGQRGTLLLKDIGYSL